MYEKYFNKLREECLIRNRSSRTADTYINNMRHFMSKGQIFRSTPNTAPLICGACNTQPEGLLTTA